jgi:hypothetical protein
MWFKRDSCKSSISSLSSISFWSRAFSITINSDAMLCINILICPFKIYAGITCMSFVHSLCRNGLFVFSNFLPVKGVQDWSFVQIYAHKSVYIIIQISLVYSTLNG